MQRQLNSGPAIAYERCRQYDQSRTQDATRARSDWYYLLSGSRPRGRYLSTSIGIETR
jgi:hypothetical protein